MIFYTLGIVKYGLLYYVDLLLSKVKVVIFMPHATATARGLHCNLGELYLHRGDSLSLYVKPANPQKEHNL